MHRRRFQLNRHLAFDSLFVLLMALIFVRFVFQVPFPTVILLALTLGMVLLGDRDEIIAACILCLPLTTVFPFAYTLLAAIVMLALKCRREIRLDAAFIPILLLMAWELIHSLVGEFSPARLAVMFAPVLLCGMLMWLDCAAVDYGRIVRYLAVCTCVICATQLSMVLLRSGFSLTEALANMQRLGSISEDTAQVSFQINPNSLGVLCVLAMTGLLQLMSADRKKPGDGLMCLVLLVSGALTMSRTYLVLAAAMALLFWLGQKRSFWGRLWFLLKLTAAAFAAVAVLQLVFPAVLERFVGRFDVSDLSSGRSALFARYNQFLVSDPVHLFFGIGLTNFSQRIMTDYAVAGNVPHNGIQEALLAWGIPGLAVFLVFLGMMLWRGYRCAGRQRIIHFIPLILLAAKIQAGQMLTSGYTMLAFSLAYLSLCQNYESRQTTVMNPSSRANG